MKRHLGLPFLALALMVAAFCSPARAQAPDSKIPEAAELVQITTAEVQIPAGGQAHDGREF